MPLPVVRETHGGQDRYVRGSRGGPERYVLGLALLVPLAVVLLLLTQLPAMVLASPSSATRADDSTPLVSKRPAASNPAPPPTLVPPAATATPLPTPAVVASPAPQDDWTYVVKPGDELKNIAAEHNVPMSKLIAANTIPDPDSLRVGQVLHIP
jgi:LysM repeat protein